MCYILVLQVHNIYELIINFSNLYFKKIQNNESLRKTSYQQFSNRNSSDLSGKQEKHRKGPRNWNDFRRHLLSGQRSEWKKITSVTTRGRYCPDMISISSKPPLRWGLAKETAHVLFSTRDQRVKNKDVFVIKVQLTWWFILLHFTMVSRQQSTNCMSNVNLTGSAWSSLMFNYPIYGYNF